MFLVIGGVLDAHEVAALREAAAEIPFEDGAKTAGKLARRVKNNTQAAPGPGRDAILKKVEKALLSHPVFASAVRPKAIVRLLLSRYAGGQAYGSHVDDALMAGARTDVSFTLSLTDPGDYEGGALVVEDLLEDRRIRLEAGDMVVYPSDTLHRVEAVTRGERLAVVGWAQSWVRDVGRRQVLFDLDALVAAEDARGDRQEAQLNRLARTRSNLLRMWAE